MTVGKESASSGVAGRRKDERSAVGGTDAASCPLCGGSNGCAVEAGRAAESCWCMTASIDEDVLARVPPLLRGRACVCADCAERGTAR